MLRLIPVRGFGEVDLEISGEWMEISGVIMETKRS